MSCDPNTGEWRLSEVVALLTRDYEGDLIIVTVGDDEFEATGNHPFWVTSGDALADRPDTGDVYPYERVLTDRGRWVQARDLQVGDTMLLQSGATATVGRLTARQDCRKVYNITVDGLHTYAVGVAGVLVHNNSAEGFKRTKPHLSGKAGAKDVPSWAEGNRPKTNENGRQFAERVMNEQYGPGAWEDRMDEFRQIQKWGDRAFE